MESFFELFLAGFTHALDLPGEVQGLAGHRMVEVHGHAVLAHRLYLALDHLSGGVEHRDDVARHEEVFAHLAVDLECALRNVGLVFRFVCAVAFLRGESEFEVVTRLLLLQFGFEFGEEHPCSMYVFERGFRARLVGCLAFHVEFVAYRYHFVLSYFHCRYMFYWFIR